MTKRELSQLYFLKKEIAKDKERLARLEAAARKSAEQLTGMPRGGVKQDKVGDLSAEIADLEKEIDRNVARCYKEMVRITRYVDSIPDSQMRLVFKLRYVDLKSWAQIAMTVYHSHDESTARKAHDRFLNLSDLSD